MNVALVVSSMGISSPLLSFDTHSTTGNMPGVAIGPASTAEAVAGKSLGVLGVLRSGLPKETTADAANDAGRTAGISTPDRSAGMAKVTEIKRARDASRRRRRA
jgi:hypothetical protein